MSRAVLIAVLTSALLSGCKPSPPRGPGDDAPILAQLAKELDRGAPSAALWPAVPPELRTDLEVVVAADPGSRLRAARERLAAWTLELDDPLDELTARFRAALEGVYLAEPLALAAVSDDTALAAAGLLYRLYAALDQPRYGEWLRAASQLGVDRELHERLAAAAPAMRAHLGAKLLRGGQPADAVAAVLRDLGGRASRAHEAARARAIVTALVTRLGDAATVEDWFSAVDANVRVDDRGAAAAALERARAAATAAQRDGDRRVIAGIRGHARDLARLDRYLAIRARTELAARLDQIDLLRELGRTAEARAAVRQLRAAHPNDARLRVRSAALAFEELGPADPLKAATHVARELAEDGLEHKDGDYWAMLIGAEGMHLMGEILPELARDPAAGAGKMRAVLTSLRARADELAKANPGRAAVLAFVLDRVIPLLDGAGVGAAGAPAKAATSAHGDGAGASAGKPAKAADGAAIVGVLRTGLADALALRAQHPDTIDADRLVFTLATFAPDRAAGLAAVAARPKTASEEDPELYLLRARTAMALAVELGTPAAIATARALASEIAPSWDAKVEAAREALLGDCDALDALLASDPAGLARAAVRYQAARALHKEVRARVTNNLGWIAAQRGDPRAADALFLKSAGDESERRWVPFLNAVSAPPRAGERLEALRTLVAAERAQGKPPVALLVWLASVSPDAKEAADAAREAIELRREPFTAVKPDGSKLGIETEGVFQVGLGVASLRLYELNTQAYASLWLMPPLPLDAAQLEAKATATSKATPTPATR